MIKMWASWLFVFLLLKPKSMCQVETLEKTVLASLFLFLLESALSGGLPCICCCWWTAEQPTETAGLRRRWQCTHPHRGVLVHPAAWRRSWKKTSTCKLLSPFLGQIWVLWCACFPYSFWGSWCRLSTGFKMSFLCIDHVRDSKEGTLGQLGRASL